MTATFNIKSGAISGSAPAKKLSILIARLSDDANNSYRTTLFETIRGEFGNAVELTNWPDEYALADGYESDIERSIYERIQKLLKQRNADLLISGRVKGWTQDSTILSLRFTVAEAGSANPETYRLTETFDLPTDFIGNLGAAISARVVMSAAPAVHMSGHYLVPLMRAVIERFEPIASPVNPHFDADTRGLLLSNYGLALTSIGRQAGSNNELDKAVDAYRAALLEYTRERVPLAWAMTQNNLGNALQTLGERESGTARLEQAVEAHRAALLERTRERVPLDWAMTQNNLGNALAILGTRENGTARLEEAVEAFRAALLEWTREREPLAWAATQNNLGVALQALGERESGTARLEEAVDAFRAALDVFEPANAKYYIEMARNNLAQAKALLAQKRDAK